MIEFPDSRIEKSACHEQSNEDLARRLSRLEFENRRLRWSALTLVSLGVLMFTTAGAGRAADPRVVEAEKFVLRAHDGTLLGEWGSDPFHGDPALTLWGRDKSQQSSFHAGGLYLSDRNEEAVKQNLAPTTRVGLRLDRHSERAEMVISDRKGNPRSILGVDTKGTSGLAILDRQGKVRIQITVWGGDDAEDSSLFEIVDKDGKRIFNPTASNQGKNPAP